MSDERTNVLQMLSDGKITVEQAMQLLDAISAAGMPIEGTVPKQIPRFLRVLVQSADGDNVNIRLPFALIKAGVKFKSWIPEVAQRQVSESLAAQGINADFQDMKQVNMDTLIQALGELSVEIVSEDGDKVRVFAE